METATDISDYVKVDNGKFIYNENTPDMIKSVCEMWMAKHNKDDNER